MSNIQTLLKAQFETFIIHVIYCLYFSLWTSGVQFFTTPLECSLCCTLIVMCEHVNFQLCTKKNIMKAMGVMIYHSVFWERGSAYWRQDVFQGSMLNEKYCNWLNDTAADCECCNCMKSVVEGVLLILVLWGSKIDQYHGYWCPGSLCHQGINSHDIHC